MRQGPRLPYIQGHWKTLQASQVGRMRLHLIYGLKSCSQRWTIIFRGGLEEPCPYDSFTFLFRQDLQFIDSRGSLINRRGPRRSILTCGRDMITAE
jgi:hypothetical protein